MTTVSNTSTYWLLQVTNNIFQHIGEFLVFSLLSVLSFSLFYKYLISDNFLIAIISVKK